MGLNIQDVPTSSGGWFKPKDNADALALLIEVKSFEQQRPTPNGPKDSALVDLTIFATEAELDGGEPTVVKGCRIEQTVLAKDLMSLVGAATIVKLGQHQGKSPNPAWVWRQVDAATKAKVIAYADRREAELAAAVAAAPSFD